MFSNKYLRTFKNRILLFDSIDIKYDYKMVEENKRELLIADNNESGMTSSDIVRILIEEASDDLDLKYFDSISKRVIIPHVFRLQDKEFHCMSGIFHEKHNVHQHGTQSKNENIQSETLSSSVREPSCERQILCSYTPDEFQLYFRMSRSAVEILYRKICTTLNVRAFTNDNTLIINKILMTLWLLGSTETIESIGYHFGCNKETMQLQCHQMLETLSSLESELIHWPSAEECEIISHHFDEKYKFPGIVGLIDCFQIPFKISSTDSDWSSAEGKLCYALLQIICDHTFRFRHIYVTTKSFENMALFEDSNVSKKLLQSRSAIPSKDYHILGSSAYVLQDYLLTPYYNNGHLPEVQRKYNDIHSEIMTIVEKAKTLFANKFLRLHSLNICGLDISLAVTSCCVLYNFILESDDDLNMETIIGHEIDALWANSGMSNSFKKRNQIAELL